MQQKKNNPRPTILTSPVGRMFYIVSLDQAAKFLNRVVQRVGGPKDGFVSPEFVKTYATVGMAIPTGWLQGWKIEPVENDRDFDRMIDYALGVGAYAESVHNGTEHTTQRTSYEPESTSHSPLTTEHLTQEVRSRVQPTVEATLETTVANTVTEGDPMRSILRAKPSESEHLRFDVEQRSPVQDSLLSPEDESALRALLSDCHSLTDSDDEAEEHVRFVLDNLEQEAQRAFMLSLIEASRVNADRGRQ